MSAPELTPRDMHGYMYSSANSDLRYITEVTNDGVEWCTMMSDKKGAEAHEDRLAAFDAHVEQQLKEVEKRQKEWEAEYRAKMFRNVINSKLPPGKK